MRLDHKVYSGQKIKKGIGCFLVKSCLSPFKIENNPGNHNKEETPVPIPNTEVKLFGADGTALGAEWESRSLPGFFISAETAEKEIRILGGFRHPQNLGLLCVHIGSLTAEKRIGISCRLTMMPDLHKIFKRLEIK